LGLVGYDAWWRRITQLLAPWLLWEVLEEAVFILLLGCFALFLVVWWSGKKLFSNVEEYDHGRMPQGEAMHMILLMIMSVTAGELVAEAAVDVSFSGLSDQVLFRGLRFVLGLGGGVALMMAYLKIWDMRKRGAREAPQDLSDTS
jgi:hypothetical protein